MRIGRWLILLGVVVLPGSVQAQAVGNPNWPPPASLARQDSANPAYWPNDPGFAGQWQWWGFTPALVMGNPVVPQGEKQNGIGMGFDRAWQLSIGDPSIIIAVMDSGFLWSEPDLLNKWQLNANELPKPNRDDCVRPNSYDCNGDGVFNIQDYTTATGHQLPTAATIADKTLLARADHGDVNGNGYLDPQDLIAIFSDGKDGYAAAGVNDGNGFIDDICGWDFLWDDNDPLDDVLNGGQGYSHGTGEALDSAAEGNNGVGSLGGCPNCMVLPVRGGDSFVAEGVHQGLGIYYANAMGASVVQAAQISLSNTPLIQDAINHGYQNGTLFVASAADETSMHHMLPANIDHTLMVHPVQYDGSSWNDPANTSYVLYSNDSNYGGHLALSASGTSASSEATGRTAGEIGLIFSYAHQLGLSPPLTAAEAYQLAIENVYDINVPQSSVPGPFPPTQAALDSGCEFPPDSPFVPLNPNVDAGSFPDGGMIDGGYARLFFPAGEGWDSHFGYGRVDARAALDALQGGRIPPEVDITAPQWFEVFDPSRDGGDDFVDGYQGVINVIGSVSAPRAPSYSFEVDAAVGIEPRDADFRLLISEDMTTPISGQLATMDLNQLMNCNTQYPPPDPLPPGMASDTQVHQYAATVRLRATAHYGGSVGDVQGEYRKTIFIHTDPDVLPGFPMRLTVAEPTGAVNGPSSGESSAKLFDLDGDGRDEIIWGGGDGQVHAMRVDGTELPGFPVRVAPLHTLANHLVSGAAPILGGDTLGAADAWQSILNAPAIGDVNGDGKPDIVVSTVDGEVHVLALDGSELPGFPVGITSATLPCEVPSFTALPGSIGSDAGAQYCKMAGIWSPDGGAFQRENETERGFFAAPVLADLDGDGKLDIIQAGLDGYLHVWSSTTAPHEMPGFPVEIRDPKGGGGGSGTTLSTRGRVVSTPAVGDVDGDGKLEILVGSNEVYDNQASTRAYVIRSDGSIEPGWPVTLKGLIVFVLPYVGKGNPNDPIIADLTHSGTPQLLTHPCSTSAMVFDYHGNMLGETASTFDLSSTKATSLEQPALIPVNSGSVADLDGDGLLDYVDGTVGALDLAQGSSGATRHDFDHQVSAWALGAGMKGLQGGGQFTSQFFQAFPHKVPDYQFLTNYAVADITGDNVPEIISGSGGYLVTAVDVNGNVPANWPKFTGGWVLTTPAVGDLYGDGKLEVVAFTREGWIWAWQTQGLANGNVQWDSYHHDAQNTGNFATPLEKRPGPPTAGAAAGCSCNSSSPGGPWLWGFAVLTLLRRRRRA